MPIVGNVSEVLDEFLRLIGERERALAAALFAADAQALADGAAANAVLAQLP